MKSRVDFPLLLLSLAAFIVAVTGGQIANDQLPLGPGFSALLGALGGGGELGTLPHALVALLVAIAAISLLVKRQVLQLPNSKLSAVLLLFFAVILGSVAVSAFKATSLAELPEWLTYGIALYAVVGAVGRRNGPVVLTTALFAGCSIVAARGLMEYGQMKATDPTWRIFAGWVNPNATAAVLLIGIGVGLGLLATQERASALIYGLGVGIQGLALMLTQSKGGLLGLVVLLVAFFALTGFWLRKGSLKIAWLRGVGALALVAVLAFALLASQHKAAPAAGAPTGGSAAAPAFAHLADASQDQDQSAGFRKLLWKGAVQMISKNPVGYGIGAYRYESARSGLTTQTVLTHESFLQLGVEASAAAPILLIAAGLWWLFLVLRRTDGTPPEQNALRAGVIAAVVAIAFHSFIDSDLYYFGIGLPFFMLLGVGLLLSSDAVAPEFVPMGARRLAGAFVALTAFLFLYMGFVEAVSARVRGDLALRDFSGAQGGVSLLDGIAPFDGNVAALRASVASTPEDRLEALKQAVRLTPITRYQRAYARALVDAGQGSQAMVVLQDALQRDPNNLLTLSEMLKIEQAMNNAEEAVRVARRIIDVESTPYFQIRSLPQVVPTETYDARVYLASQSASPEERRTLLQAAVDGYLKYAQTTIPLIKQGGDEGYAGETPAKAQAVMTQAADAADRLAKLYRDGADEARAKEVEGAAAFFRSALNK